MEIAQLKSQSRHYQLPAASLSALCLPNIEQAMRKAHADIFDRDYSGIVDLKGHSMMCREALESGFLQPSSAHWLTDFPGQYGLHRLTQELVQHVGQSISIADDLFPQRDSLLEHLGTSHADPQLAAGIALAAIESGVVEANALIPSLVNGPDDAGRLQQVVENSLIQQINPPDAVSNALSLWIQGDQFFLECNGFVEFTVNVPSSEALRVLLFKTLHAMSMNILPFYTPKAFLCYSSYESSMVWEIYEALSDRLEAHQREDIFAYLMDESAGHDGNVEEFFCEGRDDATANRLLDMLYEMKDLATVAGFELSSSERAEIEQLHQEATELAQDAEGRDLLAVLQEALEVCLARHDKPTLEGFHASDYPGTGEEGLPFTDGLLVRTNWDFSNLEQSSNYFFDSMVEGVGYPAIGLPLLGGELRDVTLPLIQELSVLLNLLNRIQAATEEWNNAE